MGYELWASPITGYRRHGTRLRDLDESLGHKIFVSAIAEPLRSCPANALAVEFSIRLGELDFDVAGVRESEISPVVGFVRKERLVTGYVRDHIELIDENERVVGLNANLPELLQKLGESPFVFVRNDNAITGIVTLADLNKPLVRTYFFGLISLLEIHLGYWVMAKYPSESWQDELSPGRREKLARKQEEHARRGQQLSLFQCLEFADKNTIVAGNPSIRNLLQIGSRKRAENFLKRAESLRNTLAHSQYQLTGAGTWRQLFELIDQTKTLITVSDDEVESRAAGLASKDLGALW